MVLLQGKFYPIEDKKAVLVIEGENINLQTLPGAIFRDTYPRKSETNPNLPFEQTLNHSGERSLKLLPVMPALLQFKHPISPRPNQTPWDQKKHLPNRLHHRLDFLAVQNLFLKDIHQIVPQHQQFEIGVIPPIRMGDNLIQTQSINPFFDKILTTGPLIVKMPDLFPNQRSIRNNNLIIMRGPFPTQKPQLFSGASSSFTSLRMTTIRKVIPSAKM
jgi:hypothetical protein